MLSFAADQNYLAKDANGSFGNLWSYTSGPLTLYAKVIICSLTASNTTIIIDGLNRPLNRFDDLSLPKNRRWATRQPLPSRQWPYEDSFSVLFQPGLDQPVSDGSKMRVSILEQEVHNWSNGSDTPILPSLDWLDGRLAKIACVSVALGATTFGYTNVKQCVDSTFFNAVLYLHLELRIGN